jgi:hypothetical protein
MTIEYNSPKPSIFLSLSIFEIQCFEKILFSFFLSKENSKNSFSSEKMLGNE